MFRIRTYNRIAETGLEKFTPGNYEVGPDVEQPDAFLFPPIPTGSARTRKTPTH